MMLRLTGSDLYGADEEENDAKKVPASGLEQPLSAAVYMWKFESHMWPSDTAADAAVLDNAATSEGSR